MHRLASLTAIAMLASSAAFAEVCDLVSVFDLFQHPTVDEVSECLRNQGDVNSRGRNEIPILNLAIRRNSDAEIIQLLIANGADVNAVDQHGYSALHKAAILEKDLNIISILLNAGADLEAQSLLGYTPLHNQIAFHSTDPSRIINMVDAVEMLVLAGADVNTHNNKGEMPLHSLTRTNNGTQRTNEYSRLIKILAEAGADINAYLTHMNGFTPLILYIYDAPYFEEEVITLIEIGADVDLPNEKTGMTPLHYISCCAVSSKILMSLLAAGADVTVVDKLGNTAFDYATGNSSLNTTSAFELLRALTQG